MCVNVKSNNIPDKCVAMPDIPKIQTKITFPVVVGTKLEISCIPGHRLRGSDVITCVKDKTFVIEEIPTCEIGKKSHKTSR